MSGASFGGSFGGAYQAAAPAAGDNGLIKDTTTRDFVRDVIEESKKQPVLVDFWAPWCGPCKQLTPVIEKAVRSYKGKVKLVKMNIDEHPEVAGQLGVQSIPAVFAFRNGQGVDGFMGALPESQIASFIERLVGGKADDGGLSDALALADETLMAGDAAGAMQIYATILQQVPDNVAAICGMARCQIEAGALDAARTTLALVPADKANDQTVSATRAALELAAAAANLGSLTELEQKVAANPRDHQARFDLALALNGKGKRDEATDQLLSIVKADRNWNEDGARKQLVQFFESWGVMDEATIAGRRKLSGLLFQ